MSVKEKKQTYMGDFPVTRVRASGIIDSDLGSVQALLSLFVQLWACLPDPLRAVNFIW